jgi:hypothetical protein
MSTDPTGYASIENALSKLQNLLPSEQQPTEPDKTQQACKGAMQELLNALGGHADSAECREMMNFLKDKIAKIDTPELNLSAVADQITKFQGQIPLLKAEQLLENAQQHLNKLSARKLGIKTPSQVWKAPDRPKTQKKSKNA